MLRVLFKKAPPKYLTVKNTIGAVKCNRNLPICKLNAKKKGQQKQMEQIKSNNNNSNVKDQQKQNKSNKKSSTNDKSGNSNNNNEEQQQTLDGFESSSNNNNKNKEQQTVDQKDKHNSDNNSEEQQTVDQKDKHNSDNNSDNDDNEEFVTILSKSKLKSRKRNLPKIAETDEREEKIKALQIEMQLCEDKCRKLVKSSEAEKDKDKKEEKELREINNSYHSEWYKTLKLKQLESKRIRDIISDEEN